MKQKTLAFILLIIFALGISGCGFTSHPKPGHYSGTNPEVSFDITASGVENFKIIIHYPGDSETGKSGKNLPVPE